MASCSPSQRGKEVQEWMQKKDGAPRVLCTTFIIHDMVKKIAGDIVFSLSLIPDAADPHSYEVVKGDGEKFSQADLVFSGGLGLEHGTTVLKQLHQHAHLVCIGDALQTRFPEEIHFVQGVPDPHIWLDLWLWAQAVDVIEKGLISLFPDSPEVQTQLSQEAGRVKRLLLKRHTQVQREFLQVPAQKKFLVTAHNAFSYFSKAYLQTGDDQQLRTSAPEGIAPDAQIGARDIERVVQFIIDNHVEVIFPEYGVSQDSLYKIQEICKGLGHSVKISSGSLCSDTVGDSKGYLEMMEKNVQMLVQEWR